MEDRIDKNGCITKKQMALQCREKWLFLILLNSNIFYFSDMLSEPKIVLE